MTFRLLSTSSKNIKLGVVRFPGVVLRRTSRQAPLGQPPKKARYAGIMRDSASGPRNAVSLAPGRETARGIANGD